jgi:hypothetical protein
VVNISSFVVAEDLEGIDFFHKVCICVRTSPTDFIAFFNIDDLDGNDLARRHFLPVKRVRAQIVEIDRGKSMIIEVRSEFAQRCHLPFVNTTERTLPDEL